MATADTAMLRVLAQYYSQGVNTAPPLVNHAPPDYQPTTPAQGMGPRRIIVATSPTVLHLDGWNTILFVVLNNRDTTNLVEVTYHYLTQGSVDTTNIVPCKAGVPIVLSGPITLANNISLKAFSASVVCDVSIIGT